MSSGLRAYAPSWLRQLARRWRPDGGGRDDAYYGWVLEQFHAFIASEYPGQALPRERFLALARKYTDADWLRSTNRYLGDLWYLFQPDFASHLDEYYRAQELPLTLTLLSYASNRALVDENYVRPYTFAGERLGPCSVLEFGAGIPHGVLHRVYAGHGSSITQLTTVDIDGVPARFVAYFCRAHRIPHRAIPAVAGEAVSLDGAGPFDFVFAKDIFEHLLDPAAAVHQIVRQASSRAVLALDLDDKGAAVYQHVSPTLSPLAADVASAGFRPAGKTGNLSLFERASTTTVRA
jgi:hypothetical protein